MFKSFLKLALVWIIVFTMSYLYGSLYEGTFITLNWTQSTREAATLIPMIFDGLSFMCWLFYWLASL